MFVEVVECLLRLVGACCGCCVAVGFIEVMVVVEESTWFLYHFLAKTF